MDDMLIKPYEISLWLDRNKFSILQGEETKIVDTLENLDEEYTILNEFVDEIKFATIGSNTMHNPIQVVEPKLTQNINGSNTLTFKIFYKYYDEVTEKWERNPFITALNNESKIKLYYDNKWFDFIIKKSQESSDGKSVIYTCTDLYINELAKNGYEVTLDTELENNMNTCTNLADYIIEDTDWRVVHPNHPVTLYDGTILNSDILIQKNAEPLYIYEVPSGGIQAKVMLDWEYGNEKKYQGEIISIPGGDIIFVSSTSYINKDKNIQFFWREQDNTYITNDDGVILNSPNYMAAAPQSLFTQQLYIDGKYKGDCLSTTSTTKFVKNIDSYCTLFVKNNEDYYGVKQNDYATSTDTQNLLINNNNFVTTDGWEVTKVSLSEYIDSAQYYHNTLKLKFIDGYCSNTGLYTNRNLCNGFTINDKYIFAIKTNGTNTCNGARFRALNKKTTYGTQPSIVTTCSSSFTNPSLNGYTLYELTLNTSVSNNDLLDYDLYFDILGTNNTTIELIDCLLFKKVVDDNNKLIIPDINNTISSTVKTKWYLFKTTKTLEENVYSLEDIAFDAILFEEELESNGYTVKQNDNPYEKITSITGSKSNRFNLLQELCENFKCWIKFTIDHNKLGKIIYNYNITNDDYPLSGKYYYEKLNTTNEKEDLNYKIIQHNNFFTRCNEQSTFNYNTKYFIKDAENLYSLVDLGYQFSYIPTNYYTYDESSNTYTQCKTTDNYNSSTQYYRKLTDGVVSHYIKVSVNDDFNLNKTKYYTVNGNFNSSNVYERQYSKYISFLEFIGKDNYAGFKYGINLKSITREINTENICTKLIVEPNANEFAEDGFCSIQTADLNFTKENSLYNFRYYTDKNILKEYEVNRDLYGKENGGLAYLTNLAIWNRDIRPLILEQSALGVTLNKLYSRQQVYYTLLEEAKNLYNEYVSDIMHALNYSETQAQNLKYSSNNTDAINDYIKKRDTVLDEQTRHNNVLSEINGSIKNYEEKYNKIVKQLDEISKKKAALNKEFYKKYSRYIQEGTWISEDDFDANKYYLKATDVLLTSSKPQVSYTINVIELSELEGYKPYSFTIGDKTTVQDPEFFGYVNNSPGKEYKEEVIISEVSYSLDEPSQNTIKVQNYKTRFEDLFQRIAATTQSLQYHEGTYDRAARAVNADGTINGDLMKRSLENNAAIISNSGAQSVEWSEKGIIVNDLVHPNKQLRIVGNGIAITKDGGESWHPGITADGVNADVINTGKLNTENVTIYGATSPTFSWTKDGLTAYAINEADQTVYSKFVRMDQFGLYGYMGNSEYVPTGITGEDGIENRAYFSLTWNGLRIRNSNADGYISVDNDGIFKIRRNGNNPYSVNIGYLDNYKEKGTEQIHEVINSNNNFIVYENGDVYANNGTFTGIIDASDLRINGASILDTTNKIQDKFINLRGIDIVGADEGGPYVKVYNGNNYVKVGDSGIQLNGSITFDGVTYDNMTTAIETVSPKYTPPSYIKSTYIDSTIIKSPTIEGNNISAYGAFSVYDPNGQSQTGYMGYATGSSTARDEDGNVILNITNGVALSAYSTYTSGPYLIVTTAGARMTAGNCGLLVTSSGAFVRQSSDTAWKLIGDTTAKFG